MFWPLMLAAAGSVFLYAGTFYQHVRSKGLDPSLITYSNLLAVRSFAPHRVVLVVGAILLLRYQTPGEFLMGIVLFSSLFNCALLLVFRRTPTQPTPYLIISSLAIILLLVWHNQTGYVAFIVLVGISESYLVRWQSSRLNIYNDWVSSRGAAINRKFEKMFAPMTESLRFRVLHIAVTEDIARPFVVRLAENIYFRLKKPAAMSSGIMQVRSPRLLSDEESIRLAAAMIKQIIESMPSDKTPQEQHLWLSHHYNGSAGYKRYLDETYPGVLRAWQDITRKTNM